MDTGVSSTLSRTRSLLLARHYPRVTSGFIILTILWWLLMRRST